MSDPFEIMQTVHAELVETRPGVADGMAGVVARLRHELGEEPWSRLSDVDWSVGEEPWVAWLRNLLEKRPVPADTEVLWFETPDVLLNPAMTSVSAYDRFDPEDDLFGLDEPRTWPQDDEGWTLQDALHPQPEFDAAIKRLGWNAKRPKKRLRSQLDSGLYALINAYTGLLVINNLPCVALPFDEVVATIGFADGDVDFIGRLTPAGWQPAI